MILISVFAYALTLDGQIGRVDGIILLLAFVGFSAVFYVLAKREADTRNRLLSDLEDEPANRQSRGKEVAYLIDGIIALVLGSRMMVEGAVNLARTVGISELIIAITLVAFGTSLPELAASLSAAWRKETDIAIGNVVGSNIANLLLILGATAVLQPIPVARSEVQFEFIVMIAFAAVLIPFMYRQRLGRKRSAFFLLFYCAFVAYSILGDSPSPPASLLQ